MAYLGNKLNKSFSCENNYQILLSALKERIQKEMGYDLE